MNKRIAVLVSGGGTNLQALMDACGRGEIRGDIVRVISSNPKAYALDRASKQGIPTECVLKRDYPDETAYNTAKHEALLRCDADVVVLAGYLSILPMQTFERYRHRIINTHPALIPSFCGMGMYGERVHQAALDAGVKVSGCTVHFVEEGVDTGPIILQEAVPVLPGDDAHTLSARILPVEHRLLVTAVALLCADKLRIQGHQVEIID